MAASCFLVPADCPPFEELVDRRLLESDEATAAIDAAFKDNSNGSPAARTVQVSIIMPVFNAAAFLPEAISSVLQQSFRGPMELVVFDDGPSTDASVEVLEAFRGRLEGRAIQLKVITAPTGIGPFGCGFGRNRAIECSRGQFLCFADADDVMRPDRIASQLRVAAGRPKLLVGSRDSRGVLVGSGYTRLPAEATPRFTHWHNSLTQRQLYLQQFVETTVIAPTWFCDRSVVEAAGPFDETGPGTPDDLMFFYRHLATGGWLAKVPRPLVTYRFHPASVTGSRRVPKERIWEARVAHFQRHFLDRTACEGGWGEFTIWNAGKEGRRLFRSLSGKNRQRVRSFCDVDVLKIEKGFYRHHPSNMQIPIVHWSEARAPFILCVKRGLTSGQFEATIESMKLMEGIDYLFFS